MNQEVIKSSLTKMGYSLQDCGNHWRTNALYRGGSNPTALMIYKDTGVWTDFVKNTPRMPFKDLVCATIKTTDESQISEFLENLSTQPVQQQKPKMSSEKIYDKSILQKLMPHYIFYTNKGVSEDVLVNLKGGLATEGAMYQRFVFPIYNETGQIHGFSGRDMNSKSSNRPKWKHVGKKTNWVYPAFVPVDGENIFLNSIKENRCIYLVESIGDVLSLHSAGIYNAICTFGTSISSKVLCFLLSIDAECIHICLNNDEGKEKNRGKIGSLGVYCKLLNYFSRSRIAINPPTLNDFGDMNEDQIEVWSSNLSEPGSNLEQIDSDIKSYNESGDISKSAYQSFKKHI
jgi:hypothetical protein